MDAIPKSLEQVAITVGLTGPTKLILKDGVVLLHDVEDKVTAVKKDIVVHDGIIVEIVDDAKRPFGHTIIDCKDKIISPGFVDTHHHVWQTLLKGRHANETLLDYMYSGNMQASNLSPHDIFWGQLGGCLEMIDAGTTTVVDHAHMNYSPEHTCAAISATSSSGLRSVFGYCPTIRVASWNPLVPNMNLLEDWVMATFEELNKEAPFGDGRVTIGFSWDGWFLPKEYITPVFEAVKAANTKVITSHFVRSPMQMLESLPQLINSYGLLDERFIISHAGHMHKEDVPLFQQKGVSVSSTPDTELQMSMGKPICFDDDLPGMQALCGLGADCHSNNSTSIVAAMRLALQNARGANDLKYVVEEKMPLKVYKTVEAAYNLGTIGGARAAKMGDSVGSIKVGKKADFVIFTTDSPAMVCAAQQDPVAAIVLHSSPADIDTVIVAGRVVKEGGKLVPTVLDEPGRKIVEGKKEVAWKEVATELLERRVAYNERVKDTDWVDARATSIKVLGVQTDRLVDV